MKVKAYLNYGGNCLEAFRFYEKNLGAKIGMVMTYGQSPDQSNVTPENKDFALYASLTIGDSTVMASDVDPKHFGRMRSAYLCLTVSSDEEAERIYKLFADGGEVYMPMAETFFASRFGQLRDKFGTSWMIIREKPMGPPQR